MILKRLIVMLAVIAAVLYGVHFSHTHWQINTVHALDLYPECESKRLCRSCNCKGDKQAQRQKGEPDNPNNKNYPRARCDNYCSEQCCFCSKNQ